MLVFHALVPEGCPPEAAKPLTGTIYRGIKAPPISATHFKSHKELNMSCRGDDCDCCGLSVWPNLEAVHHARKGLRYTRKWYIAACQVDFNDGLIMPTPNSEQPEHHTFWLDTKSNIVQKSEIILPPVA